MMRGLPASVAALAICVGRAEGHGMLVNPPSRNAFDRFLPAFKDGQSPQTPCTCPNAGRRDKTGDHGSLPCDQGARADAGGQPCLWWSQGCTIGCEACTGILKGPGRYCNGTLEPTLPKWAWTMNVNGKDSKDPEDKDAYRYFPWRYPGAAPVADPCGMAGGTTPQLQPGGGGDAVFTTVHSPKYNATMGDLGTKVLPYAPSGTRWLVGSKVEVGWAITYNHGGGCALPRSPAQSVPFCIADGGVRACPDQYRLCPKDGELTEACFQQHPLDYDRTKQALLFNNGSRYPLKGIFVSEGTKPAGSTWARNPVPRQGEFSNGATRPNETSTAGWVEFPPPCPWDCSGQADCPSPGTADHPGTQEVCPLAQRHSFQHSASILTQAPMRTRRASGRITQAAPVIGAAARSSTRSSSRRTSLPASGCLVSAVSDHIQSICAHIVSLTRRALSRAGDCEETSQIWQSCADVTICKEGEPCHVPPAASF